MKNAIHKSKKKVGRPATGHDPTFAIRLSQVWVDHIDAWASEYGFTRAEAIRRLIRAGWSKCQPRGAKLE